MKKAILVILWLLLSLMLPACAGPMTYEQLEAEAEITGDDTKLKKFEADADAAAQWFEFKTECTTAKMVWFCKRGASASRRGSRPMSTEQLVRAYRREWAAGCGCATPGQMRELMKSITGSPF